MERPGHQRCLFRNLGCRAALTQVLGLPIGSAHPAWCASVQGHADMDIPAVFDRTSHLKHENLTDRLVN